MTARAPVDRATASVLALWMTAAAGAVHGLEPEPATSTPSTHAVVELLPMSPTTDDGPSRIRALALSDEVRAVVFRLDGVLLDRDRMAPYAARIDGESLEHSTWVSATAVGADGVELGTDRRVIDPTATSARLELELRDGAVSVTTPTDIARLERVEIFRGDQLVSVLTEEPYRAELGDPAVDLYLRAVGHFADGSSVEEVRLVGVDGYVDAIEVPEIEIPVVARGSEGRILVDLGADDFRVLDGRSERRPIAVRRADDLPLTLGLVVDSSASLEGRMTETKRIAADFVRSLLTGRDRAFLVDVDDLPRLVVDGARGDEEVVAALTAADTFEAGGETALLDGVVYGLERFAVDSRRRALVVFTDGDSERSQVSLRVALHCTRASGVPVYAIVVDSPGGGYRSTSSDVRGRWRTRHALARIADESGGRIVVVDDVDALPAVYDEIARELSAQYRLAFRPRTGEDAGRWRPLRVEVGVSGAEARTVAGYHVPD